MPEGRDFYETLGRINAVMEQLADQGPRTREHVTQEHAATRMVIKDMSQDFINKLWILTLVSILGAFAGIGVKMMWPGLSSAPDVVPAAQAQIGGQYESTEEAGVSVSTPVPDRWPEPVGRVLRLQKD